MTSEKPRPGRPPLPEDEQSERWYVRLNRHLKADWLRAAGDDAAPAVRDYIRWALGDPDAPEPRRVTSRADSPR